MRLTKAQKKEAGINVHKPKFSSRHSKRKWYGDVAHDLRTVGRKAKYWYRHDPDAKTYARLGVGAATALAAPEVTALGGGAAGAAALGVGSGLAMNEIAKDEKQDAMRKGRRRQKKRMYKAYLASQQKGNALPA